MNKNLLDIFYEEDISCAVWKAQLRGHILGSSSQQRSQYNTDWQTLRMKSSKEARVEEPLELSDLGKAS